MLERDGLVSPLLIQPGEIEVGIGVLRIERDGVLVCGDRFALPSEVFKSDTVVERGDLVSWIELSRLTIVLLRGLRRTRLMEDPAEVDVRLDVIGIERQHAFVCFTRVAGRSHFE